MTPLGLCTSTTEIPLCVRVVFDVEALFRRATRESAKSALLDKVT